MSTNFREWLDPESWIDYRSDFLTSSEADGLLAFCEAEVDWEDRNDSRLLAWYGDFRYEYPGVSHAARPIPGPLRVLSDRVAGELASEVPQGFNGLLLNRYGSGREFVDFHADDEPSLRSGYPVAIVSVGAPRVLLLRPHARALHPGYAYQLTHGSLLVAGGLVQNRWHHAVPVEPLCGSARVSVTLRHGA